MPQFAAYLGPVLGCSDEVSTIRNQALYLFRHAAAQFRIAGEESDNHGLRIFAEQAVGPVLQPLLHRFDLMPRSTTHAARGVSAAAAVSGAYP